MLRLRESLRNGPVGGASTAIFGSPIGWTQTLADAAVLANQSPATADDAMILYKRLMNESGHQTLHSSDATSFSNAGDVIGTSSAALAHQNAYFDLISPDNKRSLLFRRGANSRSWEVSRCVGRFNDDGAAAVPPTSGDTRYLGGNATAGGFNTNWPVDGSYWFSCAVQTVAPWGSYFFTIFTTPSTTQAVQPETGLLVDPLQFFVDPNDPDPCIYNLCGSGNTGEFLALTHTSGNAGGLYVENINNVGGGPRGWLYKEAAGGLFTAINPLTYSGSSGGIMYPSNGAVNLDVNEDNPMPVPWGRSPLITTTPGAPYGMKGFSTVCKYPGQFGPTGAHRSYSTAGAKDGIIINSMVLPWPAAVDLFKP